jgi:hypothetical protein
MLPTNLPATTTVEFGPVMRGLGPTEQAFVCALFDSPPSVTKAAELAGMTAKTRHALRMQAHRLLRSQVIGEALTEEAKRRTTTLLPRAQAALEHLLDHPEHPDFAKAIKMVRDDAAVTAPTRTATRVDVNVRQVSVSMPSELSPEVPK